MGFFDRIKSGANKASERAQSVMEVNKLNAQVSNIEREMGIYYQRMGQVFYEGYRAKDMTQAEKEMMELAKTCDLLAEERDDLRFRIASLRNERLCECGKVVPEEAVFCPYCGNKLRTRSGRSTAESVDHEKKEQVTSAENEMVATDDTMVYRGPLIKVSAAKDSSIPEDDERQQREVERQLELDRRIQTWKENMSSTVSVPGTRDTKTFEADNELKCQICAAPLAKGTHWCPHCGAEQI